MLVRAKATFLVVVISLIALHLHAASVGPAGYTNSFDAHPDAADWATYGRPSFASDIYDMDIDVNATITAALVSKQTVASSYFNYTNATWNPDGFYLETRPSSIRYIALMNKLVNNSGTNATQLGISYLFTVGPGEPETWNLGTRVYFSLTGETNSWTNLVTLNVTNINTGTVLKAPISRLTGRTAPACTCCGWTTTRRAQAAAMHRIKLIIIL